MDDGLAPANHRDRVAASGVDLLLVLLLGSATVTLLAGAAPQVRLGGLLLAVGVPTLVVEGTVGRSPGKLGVGLRHAPPGVPGLTLPAAVGRFLLKWLVPVLLVVLGLWLAALVWWVALYLPAFGPGGRAAHDRLTRTRVLGPTEARRRRERATDY